ncbi:MAG: ABC-2 family transporter protein [Microgenomates group bacterium]
MLKRNLKIFYLFSRNSLKTVLQTRQGILFFTLGKILRFLFLFGLIFLIFSKTKIIKGWSLNQVIICYLTFNFLDSLSQTLYREVYRFRPLVISGNLDLILTKPYHPFLRILLGGVDFLDLFLLFPYIFLLIFFIIQEPNISFTSIAIYLFLLFNSFLIITSFHIFVLSLAVLTTEIDNAIMIYRDFLNIGRFPVDLYKTPFNFIFTFVLPIGVMITFPVKALFRMLFWPFILFSFITSLLLLFLSFYFWQKALKYYQSASS